MSQQYSIIFKNDSSNIGTACLFQRQPDASDPNVMSLAWFARKAAPATVVQFSWGIDYCFVWSETGDLMLKGTFESHEIVPANLETANSIKLVYTQGCYQFVDQGKGAMPGTLLITEGAEIPLKKASVGIGMSGSPTLVVQAQPNMNLSFSPHPQYWIVFGNFEQGQVLDTAQMTDSVQIVFPPNCYQMKATLKIDNTWDIEPA